MTQGSSSRDLLHNDHKSRGVGARLALCSHG